MSIKNALNHFRTITKHRHKVMLHCFKAGIPLQGLKHDLSKYSPTEFSEGVRYYQGNRSPNDRCREVNGCSRAWMHHKGRNKHHFEYWTDYNNTTHVSEPVEMPLNYVIEMFCDRVAASKIYGKDKYSDRSPLDYYNSRKDFRRIHPNTAKLLEELLIILADKGEKETFRYIRSLRKEYKNAK